MHYLLKSICFIMISYSVKSLRCKSWEVDELSAEDIEKCMIMFCGCPDFRVKDCPEIANYVDVVSLVCKARKIDGLYCIDQYAVTVVDGWSTFYANPYYEMQIYAKQGFMSTRLAQNRRSSNNSEQVGAKLAFRSNIMTYFPHKIDTKALIWGRIAHFHQSSNTNETIVSSPVYYQITYNRQDIKPARRGEVKKAIEETIIVGPIGQFERTNLYFHLPHYFNVTIYEDIRIFITAVQIDSDGTVRQHTGAGSHYFQLTDLYYMTCFGSKVDEENTNQTIYSSDGCIPYPIFNRKANNDKLYLNSNFKYECICEPSSNHTKPDTDDGRRREITKETELDVAFGLAYTLFIVTIISVIIVTILVAIVYYIPESKIPRYFHENTK